jgi:hypothetical protein
VGGDLLLTESEESLSDSEFEDEGKLENYALLDAVENEDNSITQDSVKGEYAEL